MPHKLRKSQLVNFENAAAGHPGVLSDKSGEHIVKPCTQAEIDFYQGAVEHPELKYYMPLYWGFLSLNQDATEAAAAALNAPVSPTTGMLARPNSAGVVPVKDAWIPSAGKSINAETGIIMENVAHGFSKPNILDVKLGAQLWDDNAPIAKREKLDKVAEETTSKPLGYRIAGMKIYIGKTAEQLHHDTKGYRKFDKNYGRGFNVDNVANGFKEFFFVGDAGIDGRLGKRVIKRFLLDLRGLQEVLEKEETRMYSASLLFVYEGDGELLTKNFKTEGEMLDGRAQGRDQTTTSEPAEAKPTAQSTEGEDVGDDEEEEDEDTKFRNALPRIISLKMIDFAHATFVKGQGPDENVLHGIRSVISILEKIIQ